WRRGYWAKNGSDSTTMTDPTCRWGTRRQRSTERWFLGPTPLRYAGPRNRLCRMCRLSQRLAHNLGASHHRCLPCRLHQLDFLRKALVGVLAVTFQFFQVIGLHAGDDFIDRLDVHVRILLVWAMDSQHVSLRKGLTTWTACNGCGVP